MVLLCGSLEKIQRVAEMNPEQWIKYCKENKNVLDLLH